MESRRKAACPCFLPSLLICGVPSPQSLVPFLFSPSLPPTFCPSLLCFVSAFCSPPLNSVSHCFLRFKLCPCKHAYSLLCPSPIYYHTQFLKTWSLFFSIIVIFHCFSSKAVLGLLVSFSKKLFFLTFKIQIFNFTLHLRSGPSFVTVLLRSMPLLS